MNENTKASSRPRSVKRKKRTGFTMMEMMITLAIMAILFGLAVPAVAQIQKNLEIARLNSYAKDVYLAAQNRLTSLKATGELVALRDALQNDYSGGSGLTGKNRYYGPSDPDDMLATSFKPQDWNDDWDAGATYKKYFNFYGVMHNPTDAADNDVIVNEIIPELSVTSTSLDHHYYIEFNPTTGDVYAAFYTDAKTGFTSDDIRNIEKIPYGDEHGKDSGRAKSFLRDNFVNSAGDKVMLGYYRGDPTDMLEDKEITEYDVTCELVNKEDLYVKVTCDLGDTYFLRKFIEASVTVSDAATGNCIEIPLNLAAPDSLRTYDRSALAKTNKYVMFGYDSTDTTKFVAYILLDALDTANVMNGTGFTTVIDGLADTYKDGTNVAAFVAAVKAGCNLKATADVELNFADRIVRTNPANINDQQQNSRFAAISSSEGSKTVNVGYVRHLKNLDGYQAAGTELRVEQSCVEYIIETYIDETTGEEKTRKVESTKGDIYFNSCYTLEGGDTKWYWDSDYLIGEPTGSFLRNYLNAPTASDEAYITPISCGTTGNFNNFTYNGKHYGLYDFVIAGGADDNNVGLFGTLQPGTKGIIKDTNLIDATVDGDGALGYVGGIVGEAENCEFNNVGVRLTDRDPVQNKHYTNMSSRVENLKVSSEDAEAVGGIVGAANSCSFDYSYAAVQVEGAYTAGGLVGWSLNSDYKGCYTSEPTIGTLNVGGFIGLMEGGIAEAEQNGTSVYPLYATGDVIGSGNVGGFVGTAKSGAVIDGCNSFGRARVPEDDTTTKPGGFVGNAASGTTFSNNSYLKQTRYNQGSNYKSQDGLATGRGYNDEIFYNGNSYWNVMGDDSTANKAEDSHPYTVYNRATIFPFAMARRSMDEGYDEIPHYGDWPVEASIQTMLAYYEVYKNDDGSESVGLYGYTSLVGETVANNWQLNTLQTGDTYCIEDGYAIVSTDVLTKITGTIDTLGKTVTLNCSAADYDATVDFVSEGSKRTEGIHVYKLKDLDAQGMSTDYQARMNDSNGTYFQKAVLTGLNGAEEVFTDYTFFYCPVLAKSAINPTPAQADDKSLCPTTAAMEINKPEAGIIRSARQLNAMGRMNWFWNMNLNQECHVDFGQYVKTYCDTPIDLSGSGQSASNVWRNKPIGSTTSTYGEKPYSGTYDGGSYKIIDYCLSVSENSDSTDAGLFGLLREGTIKNVVLYASNPNDTSGATAWVRSSMAQGNGSFNVAPLVGHVDYNSTAYAKVGGSDRLLKEWSISGDSLGNYAVDTEAGTFTLPTDKDGSSGKWGNGKGAVTPQNNKEWAIVTLEGNFEGVTGATLLSTTTISQYDPLEEDVRVSATNIAPGKITFRVTPSNMKFDGEKYKFGGDVKITLTGGELSAWTMDSTTFKVELHTSEQLVPEGDDPSAYITGLTNMSTVQNCAVSGYVVEYSPAGQQTQAVYMGGLVGRNQGEIYNCSAANKRLSVTGSSGDAIRYVGGFAGHNKEGIIADCYAGGFLAAYGTQPAYVGGVVGRQEKESDPHDWCKGNTKLISSYSYCTMDYNSASGIHYNGVAGGSDSMIIRSHFFKNAICDYAVVDGVGPGASVFNVMEDKAKTFAVTVDGETVNVPYCMTYAQMKKLFSSAGFALTGTTGIADFDHSWPYDQTLVGNYPFPAVVKDTDGYFVHYGDWPAPNGTIYQNQTFFEGVFWTDFVIDQTTAKTDYNYYWGDWLKEIKYQASIGQLKTGDYIEIIVEPEFKYDAPEAAGLFQCGINSMMVNTAGHFEDEENDASYEAQGINFGNGQVYQFLFDVDALINLQNDPQLWFAIDYHSKGGIEGQLWESVKSNYKDENGIPAGHEDPFRLNWLTVNVYRDSSTSTTTNQSTRHSTTSSQPGETTTEEDLTHLELLKEWTFEEAGAQNILSTDKGSMVAGVIATNPGTGDVGHGNKITLQNAESFQMNIGSAFAGQGVLKKNEHYQVEASFALGEDATKDMYMRPYLKCGDEYYYASNYTLVQKRATEGANKDKVIWARALYSFGEEGMTIDDDAYIVWIPREATTQGVANTLNGTLFVDNVKVSKVAQGADPSATESTQATLPYEEDGKLIAFWSCDHAGDIVAPTYEVRAVDAYRYVNVGGSSQDLDTGVKWSDFLKQVEGLTESQYAIVTLQYSDDYVNAKAGDFTFTCDAYAYRQASSTEDIVLAEIAHATGDDAFNATTRTVKWIIGGPLYRSAQWDFKDLNPNMSTKSYFAYRNAEDLKSASSTSGMSDNTILCHNENEFFISVGIYDRDPNATAMPTRATTRALSGGSVGHSWTSQDGQVYAEDNWIKPTSKGTTETGETLTFAEFVAQNALDGTQYLQVTVTANDSTNPLICNLPKEATMSLKAYVDGNGEKYITDNNDPSAKGNVVAESINGNSVVFHVNGALTPVTGSEKLTFGGVVKTENSGKPSKIDGVQVKVEVMNTATVARLQGDSMDVLSGESVSQDITITLNGDTFASSVATNADVTSWFANLPGYNLRATVLSVNSERKVVTIRVAGTLSKTPDPSAEVTAVIPGSALTNGSTDVAASGSFYLLKKQPRATIIGDAIRNFYVDESGSTTVDIKVVNDTLGNVSAVPATSWFTGTLPAGMSVSVASTATDTVSLTFSGVPTEQSSIPLVFKVPASVLTISGTDLEAGTVTFKVGAREKVKTPTFGLASGEYRGGRSVSINCATENADIEYKLDDGEWLRYVLPIPLTEGSHTLKARATKTEFLDSDEATATYTILHDDNLIRNGYFEDGLDGWSDTNACWSVVDGKLQYTGSGTGNLVASLTAALQRGHTYKLSVGTLTADPLVADKTRVRVIFNAGNKSGEAYYNLTSSGSECTFTLGQDANWDISNFQVYVEVVKEQTFTVVPTIDDVVLVDVTGTEPTAPTKYGITVTNGSATAGGATVSEAAANTVITLTADAPATGKVFDKWLVKAGSVTLANVNSATTTFTMPGTAVEFEATYKDAETPTESSESTTSEPSGDRTLVAQWVTKHGISYGYFYDGKATADVYYNCAGNATVGTLSGEEMQWQAFIAHLKDNNLLTSDAYLEVTFQGDASTAFAGAQAANATLTNKVLGISGLKASYADDVKLVFRTAKGLTYNSAETDTTLDAQISGVTSNWASGTGTVKVELYTGSTGGETSESESSTTSTTESSTPDSNTVTLTNNITFNDGTNATNTIPASGTYEKGTTVYFKVSFGQITQAGTGSNKTNANLVAYVPIKANGANLYPMGYDPSDAANANPRSVGTLNGVTIGAAFGSSNNLYPVSYIYAITLNADTTLSGTIQAKDHGATVVELSTAPADTYTVTVNGGNADKTTGVEAGEIVTLTKPTTGIPEGKEFDKWHVISGGVTITNDTFTMPASNVEIEATYKWIEYAITVYDGNSYGKTTAHLGETVQVQANAAERGKKFNGWTAESPSGLGFANASANETSFTMPASAVAVRANFVFNYYNIIIKTNNSAWGTAQVVGGATTGHYAEEITLQATPASGYEFTGWYVKNDHVTVGADNKFLMTDTEVEITANFAKIVVPTHTVEITGGIVTGKTGRETIAEGENVSITASNPDTGYAFTGWTVTTPSGLTLVDASASATSFTMPKADVAITANFAKVNYTVSCNAVQNGTIKVNNAASATANYGDTVTLTATPNTGYVFAGWSVSGGTLDSTNANPATLTVPDSNVTVSATFEKQSYTITVNNDADKGTVSAPTSAQYGEAVTLSVTPKTGWKFDSWTVNAGGVTVTNNTFTMPANAVTLTANYTVDTAAPIASWTTRSGASEVSYQNGTASVRVAYNNVGADGKSFSVFMNGLSDLGSNQYMKVTYTKSNGKFGNARRAATTLDMKALSGGTTAVTFADDTTIVAYVVGAATKTTDPSFTTSWTNASAVPAAADVTVTVEVYNFTTSPIAGMDVSDVTKAYTVTVVDGTASPASTAANNSVTVTAATKSGYEFTGWTVDGTDYLYVATVDPGSTTNPLTFTMPYNNVKLTANYKVAETSESSDTPTSNNLIINGTFDVTDRDASGFGWTGKPDGLTFSNGVANIGNGNDDSKTLYQMVNFVAGRSYTISFNVDVTYKSIKLSLDGVNAATAIEDKNGGVFTYSFVADSTMNQVRFIGTQATFTLDNVVLVEAGGGDTPSEPTTKAKYTITLDSSVTGGTISAGGKTEATESETITLTATPASGYTFGGWNVTGATVADASNVSTTFTMPAGNVTVSATFNADTPSGNKYSLSSTISLNKTQETTLVNNLATPVQYNAGETATFTVVIAKVYQATQKGDAGLRALVPLTANGVSISAKSIDIGETVGNSNYPVTYTYEVVMNADTVISGSVGPDGYHGTITVAASGGTSGGDTPTPTGNLLDSYSWETVSGGMTTNGNAMELKANGKSSADFRMKNIALEAGTYTLTGSVVNGFTNALEFHIGSQTETVPAGATQNISITLNVAAATSVDLQMIASSYPGGPATVTGLALTKS